MNLSDVVLRDTRANQPDPGIVGRIYYVTDEGALERDSGVAWETIASASAANTTDTYANIPAAGSSGALFLPSNGYNIYRDTGAAWAPWGPIFPLTKPNPASFSWFNQGTATLDTTRGAMTVVIPSGTTNLRGQIKTAPATTYNIEMLFLLRLMGTNYPHGGFCWQQSSDGKIVSIDIVIDSNVPKLQSNKWTNASTFNSGYGNIIDSMAGQFVWIKVRDDGVNRKAYTSSDGQNWIEVISQGHSDFLTPDRVGFYVDSNSSTYAQSITLLHWRES